MEERKPGKRDLPKKIYVRNIKDILSSFFHHETKPLIAMFNFGQWTWKSRPDLGEESLACILNCLVTNPSLDEGVLDDGGQKDWRDPTGPTRVAQETQLGWPDWVESVAQVKKQQGQQTPGQPVPHNPYDFFCTFSVICIMCVLIHQKTSPHNLGNRSQARFLESHVVEPGTHQICFRSARTSYKAFDVPVLPFQTFRQGRLLLILISKWYFFFGTPCMCFCRHVREVNHSFGHCSNHPPLRNLGGFSTFLPHKNLVS